MSKWLNKKRQAAKEALNKDARHTELDPAFHQMEHETDVTIGALESLVKKVPYYLHPNPAARLRTGLKKSGEGNRYKHAVTDIVDMCQKNGGELEPDSSFGGALLSTSKAFDEVRDGLYQLDDEVHQMFLSPIKELLEKDGKEISHHRKKLRSRRLDYDFKKNSNEDHAAKGKPAKYTDADLKIAEEKFNESFRLSESTMANLIDNDIEQVAQLATFAQAHINFYERAAAAMRSLKDELDAKVAAGPQREKRELTAETMQARISAGSASAKLQPSQSYDYSDDESTGPTSPPAADVTSGPRAKGLYDFEAENDGELNFKEGDMIVLTQRIDENWLEGTVRGSTGIFPANYVEVYQEP